MRFEQSIEIGASQQRVWDVLTDIEAWPDRNDTVEAATVLTARPLGKGSQVRLRQPKLPEGVWDVTRWEAPAYFEWTQKGSGMTIDAGHRVDALGEGRARLTLTIDMRGLLVPVFGRMYSGLTNDYMTREAGAIKRAAESS